MNTKLYVFSWTNAKKKYVFLLVIFLCVFFFFLPRQHLVVARFLFGCGIKNRNYGWNKRAEKKNRFICCHSKQIGWNHMLRHWLICSRSLAQDKIRFNFFFSSVLKQKRKTMKIRFFLYSVISSMLLSMVFFLFIYL
jgi:hypothetical protein